MSVGMLLGFAVILGAYALLFKMVRLWGGQNIGFADALYRGCD